MSQTERASESTVSRWRQVKRRLTRSIKLRMVLLFLTMAAVMTVVFVGGAKDVFSVGWREAAKPLLMDYVDRLASEVAGPEDGPPSMARAEAIAQRLPLVVRISGPTVNWSSHPEYTRGAWHRGDDEHIKDWEKIFSRTTTDGHVIRFDVNQAVFERRPDLLGYVLMALLFIALLAWLYVNHTLKPLDAIGAGARRFGTGDFSHPIPERYTQKPDELGALAATINTMGRDIHRMLESKRALLLAISHELRSPITRARLNTELLPDAGEFAPQRDALLRDLQEMTNLVTDLLESERLSAGHPTLQCERTSLRALSGEVIQELQARHPSAKDIAVRIPPELPDVSVDRARIRLLLRNLLDNALRHAGGAVHPPELHMAVTPQDITIEVRDHGPGVPDEQLPHLAQAFYRPDSARTRNSGGVGLGLYLCRLVAQAHGGTFEVSNSRPGLRVRVTLPLR